MKYKCPKCNYVFEGEVKFCPNCGQAFSFPEKQEEIISVPIISTLENVQEPNEDRNNKSNSDVGAKEKECEPSPAKQIVLKNMKTIKSHEVFLIVNYCLLIVAMALTLFLPFLVSTYKVDGVTTTQAYSFFTRSVSYVKMLIDNTFDVFSFYGAMFMFFCVLFALTTTIIGIVNIFKSASHLKDIDTYAYELYDDIVNKRDKKESFTLRRGFSSNSSVSSNLGALIGYLILILVFSKIPYMDTFIPFSSYNALITIPALVLVVVLVLLIIDSVRYKAFEKEVLRNAYKNNN